MQKSIAEEWELNLMGKTIAGIVCHRYYRLQDILIIQNEQQEAKAIMFASLSGKLKMYKIHKEAIVQIQISHEGKMFLFHTKTKQYLLNEQGQIVEDSEQWADAYFEVWSNSFYRMDSQGYWYDIEGFKMKEKIFLKESILTSLDTKQSRQSLSFKGQDIYISENKQLIQIGKVVLDLSLNLVRYFGEKITGLGSAHITFEGKDVLQEVKLGLNDTAFINEYTHEPFMYEDLKIIKHQGSFQYGRKRIELFQAEKMYCALEGSSDHFLSYEGRLLQVALQKHVSFNDAELIKVDDGKASFYFDLSKNQAFNLPSVQEENIVDIDPIYVRIAKDKIFNVASPRAQFAVIERDGKVFSLDEGTIKPQKIEDAEVLDQYYGFAFVDGLRKMFSKKYARILRFGKDALAVSSIDYQASAKLINAIDTNGNKLVLDLRHGFEEISMAKSKEDKIVSIEGRAIKIGTMILQNVWLETLGGEVRRVIDINDASLPCFTLPLDLKQIADQEMRSVFAANYILALKPEEEVFIDGSLFITADFESFTGKHYPVILEKESGNPLHLEGSGHRNELATSWVPHSLDKGFYLGQNRLIAVRTIGEDLKEHELLFSLQLRESWIPFYDNYLPIFKQIIEVEDNVSDSWNYHLLAIREPTIQSAYVAVEKIAPYRILANKKSGEIQARIFKSKKKSIKSPEEMTALQNFFFGGSGVLMELE